MDDSHDDDIENELFEKFKFLYHLKSITHHSYANNVDRIIKKELSGHKNR